MAMGTYQMNHVVTVTLNSGEATKRLTALKELLFETSVSRHRSAGATSKDPPTLAIAWRGRR
ncbi:hypothetical protein HPB50_011368 [Hyalomma asiaticum]|uniref:Uncharacterized protein n=1 Tax=Hyalomma asiaticum TaxID=266040 RepID=A0ACB7RMA5_HYAAI|nr:hypothetical protein HPB50_011368 [Hyalomma asiaticum]